MMRCVIVDDKPLAIDILTEYINKMPSLTLVYATGNPLLALEFVQNNTADLIFLDIQMPELNGIQFLKILNGRCSVILTTAYAKYALDGFEHDVIDYLLKPISFERFYKAVEKAKKVAAPVAGVPATEKTAAALQDIFIKTEYKIQRVALDSILFVEAKQNYVSIVTTDKHVLSLQNIKSIEDKLPADKFVRVHKSYIVAIGKIDVIEKGSIQLHKHTIPIGDSYREGFFKLLKS